MKIRLWSLGNLEHNIIPTKEAVDKLKKEIDALPKEGVGDIVWGPELTCTVIDTGEEATDIIKSITDQIKELDDV